MTDIRVKICGLKRPEDVDAVASAGAAYAGFVFVERSNRFVTPETAAPLAANAPVGLAKVALVVDPTDADLDAILSRVPIDILQLHGHETPARVAEIRARYGLPVMKAIGIADADDLAQIPGYEAVSDLILVDAKPPKASDLTGGNGLSFDWRLLQGRRWQRPWMLAGGLTAENAAKAASLTGATTLDVSSGVESEPGVKDAAKITAFVAAAQGAAPIPRLA